MSGSERDVEALVGTTVAGKYRVDALIGRGGMGAVLQATNLAIGKRVALKFLYRDTAQDLDAVARFQREAEAASAVDSAHIVQIFDSGTTEEGLPFLVMELLKGEDLRARLQRRSRLEVTEVVHIAGQVARALRSAHEAGIVHRDLKPDNVFLCERDDDPTFVKIVDFGISKVARPTLNADTLTHQGVVLGTAFYMAPEQARAERDLDGRTDLWSLGAIMYEALAGRPPHVGKAYEAVLIDICTQDAADVRVYAPEVSEAMARVVSRALARDREARFSDADELYAALCEAAPGVLRPLGLSGSGRRPAGALPAAVDPPFRTAEGASVRSLTPDLGRRRTAVIAVVAALAAFAITVFWMARSREPAAAHATGSPAPPEASAQLAEAVPSALPSSPPPPTVEPVPSMRPAARVSGKRPATASAAARAPTAPAGAGVARSLRLVEEP